MKKLCCVILFLISSTIMGYAQFRSTGNFLIGGSSNFEMSSNTGKYKFPGASTVTSGRTISFTLIPQVGYFITDHIAAGAGISLGISSYKQDGSSNKTKYTSFTFSPFARYYFSKFYGQVSYDRGVLHSKFDSGTANSNISGWSLLAGYALNLSEMVTLEPQIGYASTTLKDVSDTKRMNGGFFLRAGIYVYLSKK